MSKPVFPLHHIVLACRLSAHDRKYTVQELGLNDTLASILMRRSPGAVTEAFEKEDNTEARIWVASITVHGNEHQRQLAVTAAEQQPTATVLALQTEPETVQHQLPMVTNNQTAVANEIIQRILIVKGK